MNTISVQGLTLPENFREEFFADLFGVINRAESGLLLGPAGMGKTLLLDLLELKLKDAQMLRVDLSTSDFPEMEILSEKKLVIVGDNAENITKESVQKLKSLRERHRPLTSIILISEQNVLENVAFSENSSLKSVIMENILFLPPLSKVDAKEFALALASQSNIKLETKDLNQIVELSGGAPKLIKRLIKLTQTGKKPEDDSKLAFDLESLAKFINTNPSYKFESPLIVSNSIKAPNKDKIGSVEFAETLTKQEAALAKALVDANGELVGREEMIKAIWPNNRYDTSEHALDQMIHRVKKKFESSTPRCELVTLRGRGAKLNLI